MQVHTTPVLTCERNTMRDSFTALSLHCSVRHAGLLWASRRWRWARSLQLDMQENSSRELAAALFSQQSDKRPSSLNELSFTCHSSAASGPALLPWLASCTPALSVLLCMANSFLVVPPLAQLKHLVLAQHSPNFSHVAEALPRLQRLQTLSLECIYQSASTPLSWNWMDWATCAS